MKFLVTAIAVLLAAVSPIYGYFCAWAYFFGLAVGGNHQNDLTDWLNWGLFIVASFVFLAVLPYLFFAGLTTGKLKLLGYFIALYICFFPVLMILQLIVNAPIF